MSILELQDLLGELWKISWYRELFIFIGAGFHLFLKFWMLWVGIIITCIIKK